LFWRVFSLLLFWPVFDVFFSEANTRKQTNNNTQHKQTNKHKHKHNTHRHKLLCCVCVCCVLHKSTTNNRSGARYGGGCGGVEWGTVRVTWGGVARYGGGCCGVEWGLRSGMVQRDVLERSGASQRAVMAVWSGALGWCGGG
jgi:hypothetical protein